MALIARDTRHFYQLSRAHFLFEYLLNSTNHRQFTGSSISITYYNVATIASKTLNSSVETAYCL